MTATTSTVTAGGARGVPGRPALTDAERARRANRPVRDPDPARNAAYWARVDAIVSEAPPLSPEQRLIIRAAFSTVTIPSTEEAAA